ncbi:uncharacterized protein LOC142587580 [Dermacentor variabilis]|uniref:uncharacterized protein LOC142587580 n=1 Tax=Dermacentor variabilis TaxID=34621 RepID=UPI003F5B4C86
MGENLLLVVLLCITSFTVLESRKTFSIRKFLNTTSPIWTYNTTRGSHGFCNVDVMIYINKTHLMYNHIFYERTHQRKSMAMTGGFVQKDALVVKVHGCRNKYKESILFFDKRSNCAVVKVMSISCFSVNQRDGIMKRCMLSSTLLNEQREEGSKADLCKKKFTEGMRQHNFILLCQKAFCKPCGTVLCGRETYLIITFWSMARLGKRHIHTRKHKNEGTIENLYYNGSLVWAVNTTEETNTKCRVDVVTAANATYVNFNRMYYLEKNITVTPLEGNLVPQNMLVHGHGTMITSEEQLISVDDYNKCGVFFVKLPFGPSVHSGSKQSSRPWYELRVLNSTVENIPEQCLNLMKKGVLGQNTWKSLYNSTCQQII